MKDMKSGFHSDPLFATKLADMYIWLYCEDMACRKHREIEVVPPHWASY